MKVLRAIVLLAAFLLVTTTVSTQVLAPAAQAAPALTSGTIVFNSAWQSSLYSAKCTASPAPAGVQPCRTFSLVFSNPMPASLSPGQVLASATSPKLPHGLLVQVSTVTVNGSQTDVTATGTTPQSAYTGTIGLPVPLNGGQAAASAQASLVPGVRLVAASAVPAKTRQSLLRRSAAGQAAPASDAGNCPAVQTGSSGGLYFELTHLNIPVGNGVALNVQGWAYESASMTLTLYQPGDTQHPGVQAEVDETNYTDASLYVTPTVVNSSGNSVFGIDAEKTLGTINLPPVDVQVGPLPVVIEPGIDVNIGFEGQMIAGLGLDIQGGDEGQAMTFLVHSDGSVTHTSTPGALKDCADVGGGPGQVSPTVGAKFSAYFGAEGSLRLYDVVGLATGPAVFIEDWLTGTANSDSSCNWPALENDLFVGVEWGFDFSLITGDYNLGHIALGLTKLGSYTLDPCSSASVPPPQQPAGWAVGHATNAGDDYPYTGLGIYEHHDGTDPWNEWYGQCDSFAAWKVYENLAGSAAQHPPFRPDQGWAPANASVSKVIGYASGSSPNNWGDAKDWGAAAQKAGYAVDASPAPGAIAWWGASPDMPFGHVGYVTDVYPNGTVRIESYNLRLNGLYSAITMSVAGAQDTSFGDAPFYVPFPSGFIHIGGNYTPTPVTYPSSGSSYPANVWGPGASAFSVAGSAYPGTNHGWSTRSGHGLIGQELWTNTNGATTDSTATWGPILTPGACYAISAFIPDNYANGVATYTVKAADGTHAVVVNQESYTNAWAPLGTFKTDITGYAGVTLADQSPTGYYLAADAVMFAPATCQGAGNASLIIDPSGPASQFSLGGAAYPGTTDGWYSRAGHGLYGHELWTNANGSSPSSTATWTAGNLNPGACYSVSAYIPDNYANAAVSYEIFDGAGVDSAEVSQGDYTNAFAQLGVYRATSYGTVIVELTDMGATGSYVAADAMMFTPSGCDGVGQGGSAAYPAGVYGPGSPQFSTANWWAAQPGHGLIGKEEWTHTNGSTQDSRALWTPALVPGACYAVAAYIPDNYASDPATQYSVFAADGSHAVTVNQEAYTNEYAALGTYQAQPDGSLDVMVTDAGTAGFFVAADAMRYLQAPCSSQGPAGGGYPAGVFGPGSGAFTATNWWAADPGHGLAGQMLWTHTNGPTVSSTATWTPTLKPNTCYTVAAYVPDNYSNTTATYYVWSNTVNPLRPATVQVNENNYTNGWATLANFTTFDDGSITVELTDLGPTGQYVAADAVRFVPC